MMSNVLHKKLFYILSFLLLVLLILVYSNHFHNGFHFDDWHTIEDNPYIRHLHNIPLFFKDVTTFSTLHSNQNYRPLVTTTLAIDCWLAGGLKPFYFHLSMFFWYIVQCLLMFFLFYKIFQVSIPNKYNHFIALFGVSWYAFHTANAETLNYIIARSDTLSTLGVIASLVTYLYFPRLRKWHIYLIPLLFGLFAKETAVTFFALMFVYVLLFEKSLSIGDMVAMKHYRTVLNSLMIVLPAIITCVLFSVLNLTMMSKEYAAGGSRYCYMITQPYVMLHYFITFFFPVHLSADTDLHAFSTIFDARFCLGAVFLLTMGWLIFISSSRKEFRPVTFGLLWFFIALLPTSSVLPLSEVLNDHRIFFPFVGLAAACASVLGYLHMKYLSPGLQPQFSFRLSRIFVLMFVLVVIGANAFGVFQRNKVWHDEESLWRDVTIKSPKNGRGLMNYGLTQMRKGNYDIALQYYEKALVYTPYYSYLYVNMGIVKNALNKPEEAETYFRKAVTCTPSFYGTYYYYANFLFKHNRYKEAIPYYLKAIEMSPSYLSSRYDLMQIYFETKQWDEMNRLVQQTLSLVPDDKTALYYQKAAQQGKDKLRLLAENADSSPTPENYLNLSLAYFQNAQYEKCIEACKKALRLRPGFAEAYNNICSAYNVLGKRQEAIDACDKALKYRPDFPLAKGNLNYAKKIPSDKH